MNYLKQKEEIKDLAQVENKMTRLTKGQLDNKLNFIENYIKAANAADGSTFDPNANVTSKNIATMAAELNKDINIQLERAMIHKYLSKIYNESVADFYIYQLEKHEIYCHDETYLAPYCVAISIYPFLLDGLKAFGGETEAPKHLSSFNGGFINLIFALSSQFCGAVATVEYLMCFDHFAKKDYGENYLNNVPDIIKQELQSTIYAINQPASARNNQSCFWNISIFDKYYYDSLFSNFRFPDGSSPSWDSLDKLQKFFMKWFNKERTKALLTFPVVTVSLLNDNKEILDKDYEEFVSNELSKGNAFFIYTSNTVDSLSSCCRLRNYIGDQLKNDFSYSLGAGGVMTGSMNVITLNMNRFIQNTYKYYDKHYKDDNKYTFKSYFIEALTDQIKLIHKYLIAFKTMFKDMIKNNMLPAYNGGYIDLDKQYLTVGVNGLLEAVEYLLKYSSISDNKEKYKEITAVILDTISKANRDTCKNNPILKLKINMELVPAESLGVKFANWDKKDKYKVPRDCYNSYLYPVEDNEVTVMDKLELHGKDTLGYCDGGSACHINLEEIPSKDTFKKLLNLAASYGCNYFCFNTKVTVCNYCGYINKSTEQFCVKCGSKDVDYATRVIGYLKRISSFSKDRQEEEKRRFYHVSNVSSS